MKILHTSDWHLGRTLEQNSLHEAHTLYINHLIEVIEEHKVDALLVAGDVYDRALPNADTVALFDWALCELASRTRVIISSGNHDSPQRLGFGSKIFERGNVFLRTNVDDIIKPVVFGEGSDQVAVYGVPYLEPATTARQLRTLANLESEASPTQEHVIRLAADLVKQHAESNGYANTVFMSHAWFAGGESSDSERTLAVGGLAIVPLTVLDGFTYSALGHIHKPGAPAHNIRYSGSPLKFSFSETSHTKHSLLVDISNGEVAVTEIPTPVWREMADISGTLKELLTHEKFNEVEEHWIRANLLEMEIPANAMDKLRGRFPNIIKLKLPTLNAEFAPEIDVDTIDPFDLCCNFMEFTRGDTKPVTEWEKEQFNKAAQHASVDPHAQNVAIAASEESE